MEELVGRETSLAKWWSRLSRIASLTVRFSLKITSLDSQDSVERRENVYHLTPLKLYIML